MTGTISKRAKIGKNVIIKEGVIIEDNVTIGANSYIDYNAIIKSNVEIGENSFIGANCILGEYLADFMPDFNEKVHFLKIGKNAIIRSGCIIYGDTVIGNDFGTGHRVTIRENTQIGNYTNIGTLSDIQGNCRIGNYVHMHSNVHIGMKSEIKDFVWLFPYVILTNDPTPPSEKLLGVKIDEFAVVCARSIVLPGVHINKDALIGAGTVLTKNAEESSIVLGNPGRNVGKVEKIKDSSGKKIYPWRYTFDRGMPWKKKGYDEWKRTKDNIKLINY